MLVSPIQPLKAEFPIDVTEYGIVKLVSLLQLINAASPIEITELPIVKYFRL